VDCPSGLEDARLEAKTHMHGFPPETNCTQEDFQIPVIRFGALRCGQSCEHSAATLDVPTLGMGFSCLQMYLRMKCSLLPRNALR
jgi:hypothetical protein